MSQNEVPKSSCVHMCHTWNSQLLRVGAAAAKLPYMSRSAAGKAVRKSIVEKAQDVLATRGIQSHKKVPKLKNKRVPIKPSEDGSINMAGRQKAAPINGKGSYNPSWSDFVTAGSIVFPNFYEKPLDARAVNQYKGVLFYSSSTPTVKSTRFQRIRRKCSQCSRLGFPMS